METRKNNVPMSRSVDEKASVKKLKGLGKGELSRRLTSATAMLDKWMQGCIELGARLRVVDPGNEFFDADHSNSTIVMMDQRAREIILQSTITKITTEYENGRTSVVDVGAKRLDYLMEARAKIYAGMSDGQLAEAMADLNPADDLDKPHVRLIHAEQERRKKAVDFRDLNDNEEEDRNG